MKHTKFRIIFLSTVFISILSFAFLNNIFGFIKDSKSAENRQMASKPIMYLQHLDPYPQQYDKYYNDNFSIRSILVKYFNIINLKIYHKSPFPDQVIIGDDKWLYAAGNEFDSYLGKHRFTHAELEDFTREFEYRTKYLQKRGIKYYILIAPVKANIYQENIPISYYRYNKQSWGEQLIDYVEKNSSIKPINVYPTLRKLKNTETLYYKFDNHWNELGAFYATNELLTRIHKDFPTVNPLNIDSFNVNKIEINGGNLTDMLSGIIDFKELTYEVKPKHSKSREVEKVGYPVVEGFPYVGEYESNREIKGSKKPKVLLISDSYGRMLYPLLSEEFSRTVRIFDAWQYKLNEDIIEKEKPDIVILLALEANLRNLLSSASRFKPNHEKY